MSLSSMQNYKMDTKQKERLIENIRRFPSLYDPGDKDYRNRVANDEAWTTIADILSEDVETCRRIWKNLRDSFHRIDKRRQVEESKPVGVKRKCITWPFYDLMLFLKPHVLNFYQIVDDMESEDDSSDQKQRRFEDYNDIDNEDQKPRFADDNDIDNEDQRPSFPDDTETDESCTDVQKQPSYMNDADIEDNDMEPIGKRNLRSGDNGDSLQIESDIPTSIPGIDSVNLYMPCPYCNTSVLNLQRHLFTECMRNSTAQERRTTYQEIEEQVCEASEYFLMKESVLIDHAGGKTTVEISDLMDILEELGFFVIRDGFDQLKQEPYIEIDMAVEKKVEKVVPCRRCPCCLWQLNKEMCLPIRPGDKGVDTSLLDTSVRLSTDTLKHVGSLADKMDSVQSSLQQIVARVTSSDQKLDDLTSKLNHLAV